MRASALRALAAAVVLSLALTALWLAGGQALYEAFFVRSARPLLAAFGVHAVAESPARQRFVSFVPFLALMLATPGLAARRRLGGILLGVPVLFLSHVALVVVEARAHAAARAGAEAFSRVMPAAVLADALPFALWALLCADALRGLWRRGPGPPADAAP